jgi:iron(III) transport system permease protein
MRRTRWQPPAWPAAAALAAALTVVLFWPAAATVRVALMGGPGGEPAGGGLLSPAPAGVESGGVRRPLGLALETTRLVLATEALALPLGVPLAFLLVRTDVPGRRLMLGALAVAAFVPMPLHATAWLGAFGNAGRAQALGLGMLPVLAGWPGAAFVHATAALPWIVLIAGVGLLTVEPELEEAARLDLPAWRVAVQVTLRRSLGALAGAALAVAVLTAGDMTVTDLLSVRTYAEEAFLQYNLGNGPAAAGAVALPPLVVLGGLVGLGARGLLAADPARLPSAATRARVWRLGRWRWPAGLGAGAFVGAFVGLPLYSLAWRAGRVGGNAAARTPPHWSLRGLAGSLRNAWDDASGSLGYSLMMSAVGATLAVVICWGLAWAARRPGPWRAVAAGAVALALATPGPVAGMALVYAYHPFEALYDSGALIAMAAVLRTFPYALIVLWPAVRSIPPEFVDAAAVDGLGPWGQAGKVALPLTLPAAVAAWAVSFTLALGELPATNLVTPPATVDQRPISYLIWGLLHTGVESHLAGVVLVMLGAVAAAGLLALLALWFMAALSKRRNGRPG